MSLRDDLREAAEDELDRAMTPGWREVSRIPPWGDTFEGYTPLGRTACFERTYLWDSETGGDIRVEVTVYEAEAYESGVRVTRVIAKENRGSDG